MVGVSGSIIFLAPHGGGVLKQNLMICVIHLGTRMIRWMWWCNPPIFFSVTGFNWLIFRSLLNLWSLETLSSACWQIENSVVHKFARSSHWLVFKHIKTFERHHQGKTVWFITSFLGRLFSFSPEVVLRGAILMGSYRIIIAMIGAFICDWVTNEYQKLTPRLLWWGAFHGRV